jgi:CRISPR/Cas system-associated exonuclease Cas4 (RecB family)
MEKTYREPEPRSAPYVWVTWLTKLLAGENKCEWALWFKSRFKYEKLESGFDLDRWTREHDELVEWRVAKLKELGNNDVRVEDQNQFRVEGKSGTTVAGKPDIAVFTEGSVSYEDCKTGKKRDSDHVQVLLYALLTRKYLKVPMTGRIVYKDDEQPVDMQRLADIGEKFKAMMARLNSDVAPPKAPSFSECRYCDIPKAYCPARMQDPGDNAVYKTDDF